MGGRQQFCCLSKTLSSVRCSGLQKSHLMNHQGHLLWMTGGIQVLELSKD